MKTLKFIINFILLLPLLTMLCVDVTNCRPEVVAYYFIGLFAYGLFLYIIYTHSNLIKNEEE